MKLNQFLERAVNVAAENGDIQQLNSLKTGEKRKMSKYNGEEITIIEGEPKRDNADGVCLINGYRCDFFGSPDESDSVEIAYNEGGFPLYCEFFKASSRKVWKPKK